MIAYLGPVASRGIAPPVADDGDALAVLSAFGPNTARALRNHGVPALAVFEGEDDDGTNDRLAIQSGAWVLEQPAIQDAITRHGISGVIPFKASSKTERLANDLGIDVLAPTARLTRQLENKLSLPGIAADAHVAAPETLLISGMSADEAAQMIPDWDSRWVMQTATGYGGRGTDPISTADDLRRIAGADSMPAGKLTRMIAGPTYAVTGVIIDDDSMLITAPVTQLTGVPVCTDSAMTSCGNDWGLAIDDLLASELREAAASVGRVLAARGLRGMFGVDLMHDARQVQLIEVNPRWTASLSLTMQIYGMVLGPEVPTIAQLHAAAFSGDDVAGARDAVATMNAAWRAVAQAAHRAGYMSVLAFCQDEAGTTTRDLDAATIDLHSGDVMGHGDVWIDSPAMREHGCIAFGRSAGVPLAKSDIWVNAVAAIPGARAGDDQLPEPLHDLVAAGP